MNKIAAYEAALERHDTEKTAEALIDAYGTSEGFMPGPYILAYDRMEKAGGLKFVADLGARGSQAARSVIRGMKKGGVVSKKGGKMVLNDDVGLADKAKFYGAQAARRASQYAMMNPGKTTAGLATGTGVAGYAVTR